MATSFLWNQILWTIFEEDLPRNIPAKFGPNWPGVCEEKLLMMHDGQSS